MATLRKNEDNADTARYNAEQIRPGRGPCRTHRTSCIEQNNAAAAAGRTSSSRRFVCSRPWSAGSSTACPRVSAVTPGPDAYVKDPSPTVVLDVRGLSKLKDVAVTLDGEDVTAERQRDGDTLTITHQRPRRRRARRRLQRQELQPLPPRRAQGLALHRRHEHPRARARGRRRRGSHQHRPGHLQRRDRALRHGHRRRRRRSRRAAQADASGKYAVSADLPDGESDGRHHHRRPGRQHDAPRGSSVYVDAQPPVLKTTQLDKTLEKAGITVRVKATDQLGVPAVKLVLDGEERELTGPASKAKFAVKNLAQGKHVLVVTAEDKGGNVVTKQADLHRRQHRALRLRHPVAGRPRQGRQGAAVQAHQRGRVLGQEDRLLRRRHREGRAQAAGQVRARGRRHRRRQRAQRPQRPDRRRPRRPAASTCTATASSSRATPSRPASRRTPRRPAPTSSPPCR